MAKAKGGKLTDKQQAFVAEYLIDLNATQAAIRAMYSRKTAYSVGQENLKKPEIQIAIQKEMEKREKRTEITQDRVLEQYARLAFFDIRKLYKEDGSLKPIHELDDESATAVAGIESFEKYDSDGVPEGILKKIKLTDRRAALCDVARHLGMFTDKHDHTSSDGSMSPVPVVDMSKISRDERIALAKVAFGQKA